MMPIPAAVRSQALHPCPGSPVPPADASPACAQAADWPAGALQRADWTDHGARPDGRATLCDGLPPLWGPAPGVCGDAYRRGPACLRPKERARYVPAEVLESAMFDLVRDF